MKNITFSITLLITCLLAMSFTAVPAVLGQQPEPAADSGQVVDRILVIVNEDIITLSDVNRKGHTIFQRLSHSTAPDLLPAALEKARAELLDKLIERLLINQKAAQLHISAGDEEIAMTIENILKRNATSREDMVRELAAMGLTQSDFQDSIKDQIIEQKLLNFEIRSKMVIPEDKALEYWQTTFQESPKEGYHLLQIGILKDTFGGAPAEKLERITMIRQKGLEGNDFRELARAFSELPSGAEGGDIGIFRREEMATHMAMAVRDLAPGDISEVIETETTFQILKLLTIRQGSTTTAAPFDKVKEEITNTLYQREMAERFESWIKQLREDAYIKRL